MNDVNQSLALYAIAITLGFLFVSALCLDAQRRWRSWQTRALNAERNLADVFDEQGAGMSLAREIRKAKRVDGPPRLSKGDWERRMDANPRPTS